MSRVFVFINIQMKIKCVTLFDITKTDVSNRRKLLDNNYDPILERLRNQQSNFETILQIISMRSQPENISAPVKRIINNTLFGSKIKNKKITSWQFEFTVNHVGVFQDNSNILGKLFLDCEGVPMISNLEEIKNLNNKLDISPEYKNIHFEVVHE